MFQMNKTKLQNYYQFDRDTFDRVMEKFGWKFALETSRRFNKDINFEELMSFNKEMVNQVATACLTLRLVENKAVLFDDIEWMEWHNGDVYKEIMALSLYNLQTKLKCLPKKELYEVAKVLFNEMKKK